MIVTKLIGLELFLAALIAKFAPQHMRSFVVFNMLMIPILGLRLFEVGGLVSNAGNIFYALAIFGFALTVNLNGVRAAYGTLRVVLGVFLAFHACALLVSHLPVLPGRDEIAAALKLLLVAQASVIVAAFTAMMVILPLLIWVLDKTKGHPVWAYILAVPVVQVVDSAVFFPLAFWGQDWMAWAIDGTIIKIALGWMLAPVFWALSK